MPLRAIDPAASTGWRLWVQDFRTHRPFSGLPKPKVRHQDFATRDEAEATRRALPADENVIATITRIPVQRAKTRRKTSRFDGMDLPVMTKRLT